MIGGMVGNNSSGTTSIQYGVTRDKVLRLDVVLNTAVALEDLPNYIEEFTAIMDGYNQKAVYYAHAGAGELHLRPILNLKTTEGVSLFKSITADVAALVKKYKGSFSGEHGDG
eukprot:maker-scaffold6831_size3569-snap-gene-0.0 protein:Tk07783 transcript:maker-scaffold6831_size3569-snap-gene-0.0-mRNA-1 annotation:"fad-binding protein"